MAVTEKTPITFWLSKLLLIGMGLLAFAAIVLGFTAVMMMFPNGFQEQIFAGVSASKPMVSPSQMALMCAGMVIIAAAWFFVLKKLRAVVLTVRDGDPFVPENIKRLRHIWLIIALAEIFRMVMHAMGSVQNNGGADIDIRLGTWFLVFVIATLAEAFRYGAELRREQELTI